MPSFNIPLPSPVRPLRELVILAIACALLAGCAGGQPKPEAIESPQNEPETMVPGELQAAAPEAEDRSNLPKQDLTETILYEFLLAEIAGQRGNTGLAAQAYVDLAKRTRDPRIARRATEIALYVGMSGAAIEAARIWYEAEPDSQRPLQALAGLLVNAGRYDEALPLLKKLLAASPSGPGDGFSQLNRTLGGAQDKKAALKFVQGLAEDYPQLPQARFAVAQAAASAGEDPLALAEIRKASQLRPDWEAAVLLEAQLLLRKSADDALALLTRYLQKHPEAREVRLNYARMLVTQKRFADARGEFQKLLADYPDNTDVTFAVALLSLQLDDYAVAESNLRRLLDSNYRDKSSVRLYLGQIAEEQKNFPEALRWYGEIDSGDQYLPAQIRYAQVLSKQGKLEAARAHLHQVNARDGEQRVQLVLAEAQLLREANQSQAAFDLIQQALDRLPNNPDLLYDYAMLAEKVERMDILESSLRKLIELRPEHAHAYNALGYSLADRNQRLPEARDLIEKALKLAPDDAFIVDSMGWVLYRMGDLKDALGYLRRAFDGRPDPEIAAHLGEVLWALGERDEAEKVWRDAARKSPDNETLVNTIKRLKR
ncbi:MAG: tetratricopeptide repeat protein [Burkholderiales bacterium]